MLNLNGDFINLELFLKIYSKEGKGLRVLYL